MVRRRPSWRILPRIITGAASAIVLSLVAGTGQAAREDWAPVLTVQIFDEHQCVIAFLSQVVERRVDGRDVVIAKVHCEDDRAFDAYRAGSLGRFDLTECERPNREAC